MYAVNMGEAVSKYPSRSVTEAVSKFAKELFKKEFPENNFTGYE